MNNLIYNYHTHTKRCHHAFGEDEEYVLNAIKVGIKRLGFSDHIMLPGIIQNRVRGNFEQVDEYINSIKYLKEKYKDKIEILIGFEAEYMDEYKEYYKQLLDTHKIDYLILGQHCYYSLNLDLVKRRYNEGDSKNMVWYGAHNYEEGIKLYTKHLIQGMKSGLFKYVAHPDAFDLFFRRWDKLAEECSKKIIDASIKYNIPLEINLQQARAYGLENIDGNLTFVYPLIPFWQMVAKTKAKVVYGIDAHNPKHILKPGKEIIEYVENTTNVKIDYNYSI